MTQHERNEEVRLAVREYLAARPSIAQSAKTIHSRLVVENDFLETEIRDALELLRGLEQVTVTHAPLGATKYFQITAAGTLAQERGM